MKFTEADCEVVRKGNCLIFSGRIEASDYSRLSEFLIKAESEIDDPVIEYDFRPLNFLNSSGIKAFAVHFLKSKKKYHIWIVQSLTWQRVGIVPLGKLKAPGDIQIEW